MGLSGRARPAAAEKVPAAADEQGEASGSSTTKPPTRPGWGGLGGMLGGGNATQKAEQVRRKSVIQQKQAADDKKIRFTINGVSQRMTKEDFIREVSQLNTKTRKEVVDQSSASQKVKTLAKQDPPLARPGQQVPIPLIVEDSESTKAESSRAQSNRSESYSPMRQAGKRPEESETAVERSRRLAVLAGQGDEETGETPAERRRREAALGMAGGSSQDDSDDEGDARVPPVNRRGIRFAEPERGRK